MNCPNCGMPEEFRRDNESVWHRCGSVTALDGDESLLHGACIHIAGQNAIIAQQAERVRMLEEERRTMVPIGTFISLGTGATVSEWTIKPAAYLPLGNYELWDIALKGGKEEGR